MKLKVYNMQGKEIEKVTLDDDIFGGEVRQSVLREAILAYEAAQHQGTVSSKNRAKVRGGGRKPWAQKGTGRARAGTNRSPLWVGGGIIFGPQARKCRYPLPQKVKRLALQSSLRKKTKEGNLLVIDKISVAKGKTKEMVEFLQKFNLKEKTLLVLNKWDKKVVRSCSNLKELTLSCSSNICGYDILSHHTLCLTKGALDTVTKRVKNE